MPAYFITGTDTGVGKTRTSTTVIHALRRKPHPTHAHLDLTLEWIAQAAPKSAVLTNMHVDLDYATLCAELPAHIRPAFDGMQITQSLSV